MQKIAADKVNIMEFDPESTTVTSNFSPKSNSVHYYALTMELYLRRCSRKYRNSECYNFCIQTKVFGNIKFCCLIITPFVS